MNPCVYHYTKLNTLFSIIEHQSFWLTDLRSSMDMREMQYAEELIQNRVQALKKSNELLFVPAWNYFALSCTNESDSYFHFNNYADSCKGVSIGINKNFMADGLGDYARSLGYHLFFSELIYDESAQRAIVDDCLNGKYNFYDDTHNLTDAYNLCLARIKRKEFKLENEVRFIYREDYGGCKTDLFLGRHKDYRDLDDFMLRIGLERSDQSYSSSEDKHFKYACFNGRIRKYYEMSLAPFGLENVIKEIIIGPKSNQSCQELQEYLQHKKLSISVRKSEIQLRD